VYTKPEDRQHQIVFLSLFVCFLFFCFFIEIRENARAKSTKCRRWMTDTIPSSSGQSSQARDVKAWLGASFTMTWKQSRLLRDLPKQSPTWQQYKTWWPKPNVYLKCRTFTSRDLLSLLSYFVREKKIQNGPLRWHMVDTNWKINVFVWFSFILICPELLTTMYN